MICSILSICFIHLIERRKCVIMASTFIVYVCSSNECLGPFTHWYTTSQYHEIQAGRKLNSSLVSYVEQVVRAGQLHLRIVSRASAFKLHMLGAGQSNLIILLCITSHSYTSSFPSAHIVVGYIFFKTNQLQMSLSDLF